MRWIFGPVREVLAVARTTDSVTHVETPNLVDGLLALDGDVTGAFHIDYVEPCGTRTLHVVGSGGSLFADIGRGTITVRAARDNYDREFALAEPAAVPLTRQATHLLAIADGSETPRVTYLDGMAALATTDALMRSAVTRSWIAVPE